jgi:hypothetical protein
MKKNDIIALVIALVFVVGVGYYYISSNAPKTTASSSANQVEVPPVIASQLDPSSTLSNMPTQYKVQDFKQAVNLNGLGNSAPFVSQ